MPVESEAREQGAREVSGQRPSARKCPANPAMHSIRVIQVSPACTRKGRCACLTKLDMLNTLLKKSNDMLVFYFVIYFFAIAPGCNDMHLA
jgi:hypothetical protein